MSRFLFGALAAFLCLGGLSRAQTRGVSAEVAETAKCENGSAGALGLFEGAGILSASLGFSRVSDCDSTWTSGVLPIGACSVRPQFASHGIREESTPSTNTPVGSSLDAGPVIAIAGADREMRIPRLIVGPTTYYLLTERRPFSIDDLRSPVLGFRAGKYAVSAEGGRDIPSFRGEFEVGTMRITKPVALTPMSGQNPLAIEWTGGNAGEGRTFVNVLLSSQSENWEIVCRLRDGRAGSFTIPTAIWNELPAPLKTNSAATVTVTSPPQINISVPGIDKGLEVSVQSAASVTVPFVQIPQLP